MTTITFTHLDKVAYSSVPSIGELVKFEKNQKTKHLAGVWKFIGEVEYGMTTALNFVCMEAGHMAYKVGQHMSQTADIFA